MTRHFSIGLVLLPLALGTVSMTMLAARPALAQTAAPSTKKAPASATLPAAPTPAAPTPAAPQEAKPAPYDGQMMRLSEVLGSVSYLRTLCGNDGDDWRGRMQRLLESDTASEPQRRERLTAAFNRGYRSFAAVHRSCTDAARQAEQRYRNEGATLAAEIAARYGN